MQRSCERFSGTRVCVPCMNGGVSKERFYCIQDGAERNIVASGFLDFSLKSYDVCAVKPSYDYDVKRLLDILRLLSMSDES